MFSILKCLYVYQTRAINQVITVLSIVYLFLFGVTCEAV